MKTLENKALMRIYRKDLTLPNADMTIHFPSIVQLALQFVDLLIF